MAEPEGRGSGRTGVPSCGRILPLLLLAGLSLGPGAAAASGPVDECLKDAVLTADDSAQVGELRERCRTLLPPRAGEGPPPASPDPAQGGSPVGRRAAIERQASELPFTLTTHRPNYLLPVVYNRHPNEMVLDDTGLSGGDSGRIERWEAKFQISLKYRILGGELFGRPLGLYGGYSNLSYWQVYSRALSRPFRDTNHEPEGWVQLDADRELAWGVRARLLQLGAWHHSNGRSEPLSRSWNRVYANVVLERGGVVVSVKPWWRIPESEGDDDNPGIERFYGYGEVEAAWSAGCHQLSLMVRNNLRRDNMGAVQAGWSFPLGRKLSGYVQYFNGYGQSILDYDHSVNALGAGISLSGCI